MSGALTDEANMNQAENEGPGGHQRLVEIISRGQRSRPGFTGGLVLSLLSGLLMWAAFTPLDWGPLGWVCLVPMLLLVRLEQRTRWMYRNLYNAGLIFWLVTLQWMRLGDPTMYFALFALAAYLAFYWPIFIGVTRLAVHRLNLPMILVVPVFWTGLEYLRAHLMTGFAWYFLGHTQYRWVSLIQVSDLVGAYGVSFVVAAANAGLAQLIPFQWLRPLDLAWPNEVEKQRQAEALRSPWRVAIIPVVLVGACVAYGVVRRGHEPFPLGPRVALIQGNFPASVHDDRDRWVEIYSTHQQLTAKAVLLQPDLVVWPEGMFRYPMWQHAEGMTHEQLAELDPGIPPMVWSSRDAQKKLADLAEMANAALIVGISIFDAVPGSYGIYNSAAFVQPGSGVTDHYDKMHRVPFGEYIPLKDWFPFLQAATPYRGNFGIDAGSEAHLFRYKDWQFIPLICFEDTVPHLVRKIVKSAEDDSEQTQVLVNVTNDGWFHGSSELEQHLITAAFRCVETRTPLVRAVNTGISAIIDGDGVVREPEKFIDLDAQRAGETPRESMRDPRTGKFHKQLNCALVADVPLDPRRSLYLRGGDWFAAACLVAFCALGLQGCLMKSRQQVA
ncbi:apolipoprotein N-acyltransferase [Planctomicrobium sp. SH664]|uniref:apolipoprotein N-acyltransferase n=1 Tax=Planctomicrobium sp. SH664 TaxID=3448125 RepID=UPI003F5B82AA